MTTAINTAVEKGDAAIGAHLVRDVSLPALVLHREALEHNIRWMQQFVTASGAELAPHGKTSMIPALFRRQLDAGAWGITLATAVQTRAAYAHGVRRVLMASFLLAALRWLLLGSLAEFLWVLLFAQLMHACSFGIAHSVSIELVRNYFAGGHQGQGQALYSSFSFGAGGAAGAAGAVDGAPLMSLK